MEKKSKIIRYLFLVFGLLIFIIYFAPVIGRILNIANLLGMAVGIVLIIVFVFYNKFAVVIKRLSSKKFGKCIIGVFLVFVITFVAVFSVTLFSVIRSSGYTAKNETTVIVLGCRVFGTEPSRELQKRCDAAFEYLEKNTEAVAILTGGKGDDEDISEAQCLFNLLKEKGIDKNRLYIEDKSTTTDENIKFAKEIIDQNNLSTDVAIVTTAYNQKRAAMTAEKYSLNASSIPAYSGFWSIPTYFTREVFAVWEIYLFK
ncbi:MAG: YdcF family protein [Ruminococcaceae bacterium]|nr:YdcF family protein [Oscillospiraceae bacterium]